MNPVLKTVEEQLQPGHTALLVVDLQNDFCAEGGFLHRERGYDIRFAKQVADNIGVVVAAVRRMNVPVIWIRSHYDFKYLAEPHIAKRGNEGCCLEGSWGAEFFALVPDRDDTIVDKHHFNAFTGTVLHEILQRRGIRTLALAGVATNVCVDSTLRDGFFHGYHVVLLEDCVGSNNKAGHDGTLATVRANFGEVLSGIRLVEILNGASDKARAVSS
ncbi:MAG TPA: cysteine hydrolase [Pseudolabrys sp.]|nr:cysteine hydrolase [Pseudolabrys sp.]